jgi:hypothetical protein
MLKRRGPVIIFTGIENRRSILVINSISKRISILVLIAGLIAIVAGGVFIGMGFQKASMITEKMAEQQVTYTGAGGIINGIIDTPAEAQAMSDVLAEHQASLGIYSQLAKDDPNRATILNAMTMENSLNLAIMGYGLTDVVKASGAFMVVVGLAFLAISVPGILQKNS